MQRKYIYIIVFFLTIALVIVDQYVGLKNTPNEPIHQLEDELEDPYNAAEINYSLTIKNYQNDNKSNLYTYRVKISNFVGAQLYKYENQENYMVFAANGQAEFNISSNSELVITNIPAGSTYEIEQITDVSDKYTTKVNSIETKTISGTIDQNNTIEFNNETIISQEDKTPTEETDKENPFTEDNHYLVLIVFLYASIILFIAFRNRIKRFN